MNKLEKDHRAGKHDIVPALGCSACIEQRDRWYCGCNDLRLKSSTYCRICRKRNPRLARNKK